MAIIVKLLGGLGNQMFQYAFGKHLALKNRTVLKLDVSFFENNSFRKYALGAFDISALIANTGEFDLLKQQSFTRFNKLKKAVLNTGACYIREDNIAFNSIYFNTGRNAAIAGYWQSEKYFVASSEQIRKDLEIKTAPSGMNEQTLSEIRSENAVSLHIRRGDYQTKEGINIHGVCDMDYYHNAAEYIASKNNAPFFYIFSDDPMWAKQNLNLPYPYKVVDINSDDTAYEDLRLMANCKHNIIANSTFSWWGAWLNPNPNKVIIAPKRWFTDAELERLSSSIVPPNWIRL